MNRINAAIAAGEEASVGSGDSASVHSFARKDSIGSIVSDHRIRQEFVKDKDRDHPLYETYLPQGPFDAHSVHSRQTPRTPRTANSNNHHNNDDGTINSRSVSPTPRQPQQESAVNSRGNSRGNSRTGSRAGSRGKKGIDHAPTGPVMPTPTSRIDGFDHTMENENENESSATTSTTLVRAEKLAKKKKKNVRNCGRVQFEKFYEPPENEPPPTLICEECEKRTAVSHCRECNEVFCESCCTLCHMREGLGAILHPHERDEKIRPIRIGDTSRVVIYDPYYMPSEEVFEDDMLEVRDLSQVHSLSSDISAMMYPNSGEQYHHHDGGRPHHPMVRPGMPKYKVKDIVLFIDPASGFEAYGRIISEWDFRHGESAPTLVRGEKPGFYYVIQMLDFIGDMDIQTLVEMTAPPPTKVYAELEGVGADPLKNSLHMAAVLDHKLRVAGIRKHFGPKWHFKPANAATVEPDDESSVKGGDLAYHLGLNAASNDNNEFGEDEYDSGDNDSQALTVDTFFGNKKRKGRRNAGGMSPKSPKSKSPLKSPSKSPKSPSKQVTINVGVSSSAGAVALKPMDAAESAESYVDYVISETKGTIPKYAQHRFPSDAFRDFQVTSNNKDKKEDGREVTHQMQHDLLYKMLIFNESEISLPQERSSLLANARFDFLYRFIDNRFVKIFIQLQRKGFDTWRANMEHLRFVQHNLTARRIQSQVRRWLCRDVLQFFRNEIIDRRHKNWERLHAKFDYCHRDTPHSVTMDHRLYFRNSMKASRFADLCRRVLSKIFRHLHNRRLRTLRESLHTWRCVVTEFNERNLKTSHIEAVAEDIFGADEVMSIQEEQMRAFRAHANLQKYGKYTLSFVLCEIYSTGVVIQVRSIRWAQTI
jgi:hypothetical protein